MSTPVPCPWICTSSATLGCDKAGWCDCQQQVGAMYKYKSPYSLAWGAVSTAEYWKYSMIWSKPP